MFKIEVKKNKFYLYDKADYKGLHHTVNTFFNSLAENSGKKAIGVILSGLGSDGTQGITSIKNAGGMVIARNPETTEYNGMPSSAIATGLVDYILEPSQEEIVEQLIPKNIKIQLYKAVLDSHASEHGARMTAMDKATDNAGDLLKKLKLAYNQARQAAITTELSEIVSGAAALSNG